MEGGGGGDGGRGWREGMEGGDGGRGWREGMEGATWSMHQNRPQQSKPIRYMTAGAHTTHIRTFRTHTSSITVISER